VWCGKRTAGPCSIRHKNTRNLVVVVTVLYVSRVIIHLSVLFIRPFISWAIDARVPSLPVSKHQQEVAYLDSRPQNIETVCSSTFVFYCDLSVILFIVIFLLPPIIFSFFLFLPNIYFLHILFLLCSLQLCIQGPPSS
jgi:hypothetical protein